MRGCERCGKQTNVTTMSRFNTETICLDCENTERAHPAYPSAREAEEAAVRAGNTNFAGVGLPPDLQRSKPVDVEETIVGEFRYTGELTRTRDARSLVIVLHATAERFMLEQLRIYPVNGDSDRVWMRDTIERATQLIRWEGFYLELAKWPRERRSELYHLAGDLQFVLEFFAPPATHSFGWRVEAVSSGDEQAPEVSYESTALGFWLGTSFEYGLQQGDFDLWWEDKELWDEDEGWLDEPGVRTSALAQQAAKPIRQADAQGEAFRFTKEMIGRRVVLPAIPGQEGCERDEEGELIGVEENSIMVSLDREQLAEGDDGLRELGHDGARLLPE